MKKIHYGWVVVAIGSLVLFSCFGLARYAYSMLIPAMQAGLGLDYDKMGFIGTGNFVGYLVSVVLAPLVMRRFTPRITISVGLLLLSVCLLCIGISNSYVLALMLYLVVGIGSGLANIPMMALITYWFRSEQRGRAAGLVIGGNGFGIMLAGFLVPLLNREFGVQGWRAGWLVLGLVCMTVAVLAALFLRNNPGEVGLEPVGKPVVAQSGQFADRERRGDGAILLRLGLLYLVFGATFMVYGTFMVTTMVKEYGLTEARAGYYWSWVGFFSLFSGVGFGSLSDRIGRKWGLCIVFLVQSVAYLLVGMKMGSALLAASIVLYGVAVFAIPAIMAAAIGDYLGVSRAASAFATVTIFFAVGQSIGPASAGMIAKSTGTFSPSYLIASLLTLSAAVFAATLPSPCGEGGR